MAGRGLTRDWAGKPTDITLPLVYSRALPDKRDSGWDPQRYQADVIVVNVGTDSDHDLISDQVLTGAYAGFVQRIRTDYPKAGIVLCQSSFQKEDSAARAQLWRVLMEVQTRQAKAGDQRVALARCRYYPGSGRRRLPGWIRLPRLEPGNGFALGA